MVRRQLCVADVVLCDETLGTYDIVKTLAPDVIVLGHDQQALEKSLPSSVPIVRLPRLHVPTPTIRKPIAVAAARFEGRFLFLERKDTISLFDKRWEFPGGHVEKNETLDAATCRELREESGLEAGTLAFLGECVHDWNLPGGIQRIFLNVFLVEVSNDRVTLEPEKAYQYAWLSLKDGSARGILGAGQNILRSLMSRGYA